MKKQLNISWDGIHDSTGYIFSFAKALSAAVKNSPYSELTEDIIATSGFSFRMWVDAHLCPSATSIWSFDDQKKWVENGGLTCDYVGRYWGQDNIEEQKRLEAIENIKKSIDNGIPAISWDIGVPEWGLIIGYNDDTQMFSTLAINADHADPTSPSYNGALMPYNVLGKRELPLLSVLTITGKTEKTQEDILKDTLKLAVSHLKGDEWCENAKGIEAYPALIKHFTETFNPDASWNMEYYLGTYGALKYYSYRYFEKVGKTELATIYKDVYSCWQEAFTIKTTHDISDINNRNRVADLLKEAYANEKKAMEIMMRYL
ncbi:hypothetical protein I5677_14675 [Mobilitalea sibirica]|uniref:Uncharacterized protein n=1 Tax=Mobilitalea sibirica TaxID=1462919 RepID=A0A8J7H0T6_9FIRM|nr:hypothetical protein [Mobilitalea sibirica]MBH1942144.1 hypothetical protein [Mobilitalea sibirica]